MRPSNPWRPGRLPEPNADSTNHFKGGLWRKRSGAQPLNHSETLENSETLDGSGTHVYRQMLGQVAYAAQLQLFDGT